MRLDDALMEEVDERRGLVPRNLWLVAVIKNELGHDLRRGLTETGPAAASRSPAVKSEPADMRSLYAGLRSEDVKPLSAKPVQPRPIIQKRP